MKTINPVDAARIELLLADLRLPAIKLMWTKLAEQSDKEGWPAARFLAALAEHEIADRGRRRIEALDQAPGFDGRKGFVE
jgi:DNA replication protein DnaC